MQIMNTQGPLQHLKYAVRSQTLTTFIGTNCFLLTEMNTVMKKISNYKYVAAYSGLPKLF